MNVRHPEGRRVAGAGARWLTALLALAVLAVGCSERGGPLHATATPATYPSPTSAYGGTPSRSTLRWAVRAPSTPTPSVTPNPTPTPAPITYVVQPGESLADIAFALRVTVVELMAANGLGRPDAIRPGDPLLVPRPGITPTPAGPEDARLPGS